MKQLLSIILVFVCALSICACRADMTGTGSSIPTEEQPKAIQIIAPVDIYEGNAQAAGNVNLTVQEGYKLIQDMNSDDYPYKRYFEENSNAWWHIDIVPMLLEEDMQYRTMSYTARTNHSGFFKKPGEYIGKETTHDTFVRWIGASFLPLDMPKEERPEHIWVDILIKADDHVVGFAVVEIVDWHDDCIWECYTVDDRYTEYYPLIDGQLQEVDEAFVWQRVEQYHQYAE